ncbi:Sugar phosphate isomerase [Mycena kentingensis (nom. inval.)]|nr:Sugar phosphate isomerase [Mycena kentingensis (nom. inval.)]
MKLAIPTFSLGRAWVHGLDVKLAEAGRAGFDGVEIFWEDIVYKAQSLAPEMSLEDVEKDEAAILKAAEYTKRLCDEHNLSVLCLQPFMNYEGLVDAKAHEAMLNKLRLWFKAVKILRTDMIQVPSQMNALETTGSMDRIVADLREIADMGLKQNPPIRFAYEALSWGAHVDLWEQAWDIVERVDCPNFGTLLDTYHILARVYGDPTAANGILPNADELLEKSLAMLSRTPGLASKLFYIQLSDAELLSPPLTSSHPFFNADQKVTMQWSRNARLFPAEGYLPVDKVARVIFDLGWSGWVSLEVFNRSMTDPDPSVPRVHAERGMRSWEILKEQISCK